MGPSDIAGTHISDNLYTTNTIWITCGVFKLNFNI